MSVRRKLVEVSKDKVASLENLLESILKPIRPRQEFVHGLRQTIRVSDQPLIVHKFTRREFILLLVSGLVSIAVLMVLGARVLFSLLTALGIIQQADRQLKSQERIVPRHA
jgi:hypothetical protein